MTDELRILILEDEVDDARLLERELARSQVRFTARHVADQAGYLRSLDEFAPEVILSDYRLKDFDGRQALRWAQERVPHVPFIIVTEIANEETAVECMKAGAVDYVLKEHIGRIGPAIQTALEKKKADRKLCESEQLLGLITDNVADLIAILDPQGNRLYNSASYKQILGDPESLLGTSSFKEIHQDDVARIKELFAETVRLGSGKRAEFRFVLQDGTIRHIESQGSVIRDPHGNVDKVLIVSRDVTERKRAEEELRRSEERFRALIENSSDAIVLLDPEGVILYAGPSTARVIGYRNEDFVGLRLIDLVHPEDTERTVKLLNGLMPSAGQTVRIECRIRNRDGVWRWTEGAAKNLLQEPAVQAIVVNYRDITDRKIAEAEIQKLAAFPLFNPNPVLELAADGALTYFNDAAQQVAHLLGRNHPREILPPGVKDLVALCLSTGKSRTDLEITTEGRTFSWFFFPIPASRVVQCYAFDITERFRLEAQLRQSQKMESVGQLAAGVAHDFNNILTIIQGHAELLLADRDSSPRARAGLTHISVAASRAANLTRHLLTFSRRQVMQPKILDLNEVVGNVTNMLNRLLGDQITLQCHYAPSLPPVLADPGMIEQLLMNLSVNAHDAMAGGGQLIVSTFALEIDDEYVRDHAEARPGQFVCLRIRDTGTGMDPATLSRIFEPFFTTKDVGKGTGLGLASVYGIVKLHNGWTEVESGVGMGSTFTIFLPVSRTGAVATENNHEKTSDSGGNETVLVVEGETALRGLTRAVLQHYGYHVLEAATESEALQVWENNSGNVDLLLIAMNLSDGLDASDLARDLQQRQPRLRVVFTSTHSLELAGEEGGLQEGLNFVQKPFQPLALAQTVRRCLDHTA